MAQLSGSQCSHASRPHPLAQKGVPSRQNLGSMDWFIYKGKFTGKLGFSCVCPVCSPTSMVSGRLCFHSVLRSDHNLWAISSGTKRLGEFAKAQKFKSFIFSSANGKTSQNCLAVSTHPTNMSFSVHWNLPSLPKTYMQIVEH